MIAAPLAPPVVVIPQAVDRLVAGPVVVAQEWMAVRQDPAGGMETTAGAIRPGVDPAMLTFIACASSLDATSTRGSYPFEVRGLKAGTPNMATSGPPNQCGLIRRVHVLLLVAFSKISLF